MPVPLAVRLSTARGDRQISSEIADPSFRKVAQGGHASATIKLHRPLTLQRGELDLFGDVRIVDTRNGRVVWNGRLEDPGRSLSDSGSVWEISALGPSAHAQDVIAPYMAISSSTDDYEKFGGSKPSGTVAGAETTSGADVVKVAFASGTAVAEDEYVDGYTKVVNALGLKIASISYTVTGGGTTSSFRCRSYAYPSETELDERALSTSSSGTLRFTADDWDEDDDNVHLRIIRIDSATEPDDKAYADHGDVVLRTRLFHEYGEEVDEYDEDVVYGHQIAADALYRRTTEYDLSDAFIAECFNGIDHFCFPEGISLAEILDKIIEFEPAYRWHVGAKVPLTGKYRFRFEPWPTSVRYECDVTDGFSAPGSAGDLYNAVTVRYRDKRARPRTVRRTSSVPQLTAAGLTREYAIDLGKEAGSAWNAARAGDAFLEEHAVPVNRGTITIARPILDLFTGRMVMPWEIEPGNLIRVKGVLPRPDALNATDRDGVSVFRMSAMDFDGASVAATCELDSYDRTTARALANLAAARR